MGPNPATCHSSNDAIMLRGLHTTSRLHFDNVEELNVMESGGKNEYVDNHIFDGERASARPMEAVSARIIMFAAKN
ncbi:hypothetical protein OPT61_g2623 [Boeremia exigua]|uniref:Uncharacterized protein n=1 Tax=Boeremia exigua TaxID=749465 RepID=A0ACC2IKV5_9PLEO|nr:hypothetical protein OPT61_g2623 [Boeremia exigua]